LLDDSFAQRGMSEATREAIWASVDRILVHGPASGGMESGTGLALGYVQSGKTTSITALIGAAADAGYRVVVALMGSTNLLLAQNQERLGRALRLGDRTDYRWVLMTNPSGASGAKEMRGWIDRDRVVLVPVLKHAARIAALAGVLARALEELPGAAVLIVDDEADQASLNTQVTKGALSRVYGAIGALRDAAATHLYVQYTATPYAPLLLEPDDHLKPDFVEILQPGPGYTGGREFFVDNDDIVVRAIPTLDEQKPKSLPIQLPSSLVEAFGNFVAGSALLLARDPGSAPISMLVHSTQRNDVQARYHFLLERLLRRWQGTTGEARSVGDLPPEITAERARITSKGAPDIDDGAFLERVRYVLAEATLWLVNSATDINKIDWNVAPTHVLVGGNKLDRGFTVEGLTVTYMNRPASDQLDTIEQRARAFGYRGDLLPYCQFFATPRTLKVLREIVDTEYDLRAQLRDWLESGHSIDTWSDQVGLLLPEGTRPTRQAVLSVLAKFNDRPAWHQLRRPSLRPADRDTNAALVSGIELHKAPRIKYGRLAHPTLLLPLREVLHDLLQPWAGAPDGHSPGWRHDDILDLLRRLPQQGAPVPVILMEHPDGGPRSRDWDPTLGFVNLLQGRDTADRAGQPFYPGDRAVGVVASDPESLVVQVHHVQSVAPGVVPPLFTLAVHAGQRHVVRRGIR
jgi:hypothetical protein